MDVGYTPADLSYFTDLIEGRDAVSWHRWWRDNEARLGARLPRAELLRLKFGRMEHATTVLETAGIEHAWTSLGRARQKAGVLAPEFVDDTGLPTRAWFRQLGALADAVEEGDASAIRGAARTHVAHTRRLRAPGAQPLGELAFYAEVLCALGSDLDDARYRTAGIALLQAIVEIDTDDDVDELPAMHDAGVALTRYLP